MRSEAYLEALRREFPRLALIEKEGDLSSRLIDVFLRVVTLGSQRFYLTRYVTTLGARIYVPSDWSRRSDEDRYLVLRHEAVHLRQFARHGWVGMSLRYGIWILPLGLALGRARLEWEAYAETIRATAEVRGREAAASSELEAHIVAQFVSGAYGWMWPFPSQVRAWIRDEVRRLPL